MASETRPARRLWATLAALPILLGACEGGITLDQVAGHYEGFVVTQAAPDTAATQASVSADIDKTSMSSVKVRLHGDAQIGEAAIEARFSPNGRIQLSSSTGFLPGSVELAPGARNCFSDAMMPASGGTARYTIQLCLGGREIQFAFANLGTKLVLDKMAASAAPALETAQDFTIDQLVERARTRNFDNQVEFENVVQARLTARNAYLNLLPHINAGTALSGASAALGALPAAIITAVRSIGDLVPFLLPSRWYLAQADLAKSAAEADALKIVQASSMNIVQGLALSVLRDEQSLERLNENKLSIIQIRDEILATEHNGAGDTQIGTSDQISVVLNGLNRSIEALEEALCEERTALSQGSGFMNPQAVALIQPVAVAPITGPLPGTAEDWQNLAVRRSVALLQMDDLAVYAQKMRMVRRFAWLDPQGDDSGSLGFGIVDYVAIGSSMVRQVYDKKNATESLLLKKVNDTLSQSSHIYHDYKLELEASQLNQRLIDRLMMNFHSGIAFTMSDLANALQARAAADLALMADQYAFLILQAQMQFLTFTGAYGQLLEGNH